MSLQNLNPEQRSAVTAPPGPTLVLAGAGSGKTRVIVERVVWLIQEAGASSRSVLALTFTNKAAGEMKSRIQERLGVDRLDSWVGTFHSFGLYVLRREMERLGRSRSFTIFDDTDQLALMKRLIKELGDQWMPVSPREALSWVSRLKQDLASPDDTTAPESPEEATYTELWGRYHAVLERVSAVDFDDLLVLTAKLLRDHEDLQRKYRDRYRHLLVDEYQDTNRAQYELACALAGPEGNIFVVGDEDQSIYSWRGANIENILGFKEDFAGATEIRLEQNYRSTRPILDAANAVVQHNQKRLGKNLRTDQEGGDRVNFYHASDADDEAVHIAETIAKKGLPPKQVAVLFRTNGQARLIEEAMRRKGLAYIIIGGIRFYARKEVKDLLCYLRLIANPDDDESLRRIVNVPPRGFGGVTLARVVDYARSNRITLLEALRETSEDGQLSGRAREAASTLLTLLEDAGAKAKAPGVRPLLDLVVQRTNYREFVEKSDEKDSRSRLEVLDEFLASCSEYDKKDGGTLADFLSDLALRSDTDGLEPGAPAVTLMTCHSAKGLEFDHVFLVGLEEGLLPHASAVAAGDDEIEEERRLCYVAMTRARKTLTLSAARNRVIYGEFREGILSRFLDEIPDSLLDRENDLDSPIPKTAVSAAPRSNPDKLSLGVRVRHARFGDGTVMFTSGSGAKVNVRIRFDTGMTRQFRVSQAPLEILEKKRR